MTIIEALVAEHRIFLMLFDQMERELPAVKTVDEIVLLCRLLEAPLHDHGGAEADLAYIALDHILHQQNQLTRLHHDHQEIDVLLKRVEGIKDLPRARAKLKAALDACRAHFADEEETVFPMIEKALQPETLLILGRAWKSQSHLSQQSSMEQT
jgi:hemerythrin-like domain-containing protein